MFKIGVFTDEETLQMMSTQENKVNEEHVSQMNNRKRRQSLTQPAKLHVGMSGRLTLNTRAGAKLVSEIDLTNESGPSKLHARIMKSIQHVYQGYLPKCTQVQVH